MSCSGFRQILAALFCDAFLLVDIGKSAELIGELLQERRWAPALSMLLLKPADPLVHLFDATRIGIPHRSATVVGRAFTWHEAEPQGCVLERCAGRILTATVRSSRVSRAR